MTNLRLDRSDSSICYLIKKEEEGAPATEKATEVCRRVDLTQTVPVIAEGMLFYPAHTVFVLTMKPEDADRLINFKPPLFRDLFKTDTGEVVVHTETRLDVEIIQDIIHDEILRQTDESKYVANVLVRTIIRAHIKDPDTTDGIREITIGFDQTFIWHVTLLHFENGERMKRVNEEIEKMLAPIAEKGTEGTEDKAMILDSLSSIFPEIWPPRANTTITFAQKIN